jgi:hypothetical protein
MQVDLALRGAGGAGTVPCCGAQATSCLPRRGTDVRDEGDDFLLDSRD